MRLLHRWFVHAAFLATGFVAVVQGHDAEQQIFKVQHDSNSSRPILGAIAPELSAFVENLLIEANIPGITLGVVHVADDGASQVELGAWGRKTEDGNGHDLSPDALFNLASTSKAFLAASLGILMDDYTTGRNVTPLPMGLTRFDWDTKVADILPDDWKLDDPWASKKANIRDILAHVSGMSRHDSSYRPGDTTAKIVERLHHLRPAYELREKWAYTNVMYIVGAHIISTYAGMQYPAFVDARIFAPLNMTSSTFSPACAAASGKLTQSWTKIGRRIPYWFNEDTALLLAGAAGVISSVEDLVKWVAMLLNGGVDPATQSTIIPRRIYDEMAAAHFLAPGPPMPLPAEGPGFSIRGYGLGWWHLSYQGHEVVTHTGLIPGFSTQVALLPADGLGVVILANANNKGDANEALLYRIVEGVLDLRRIDRSVKSTEPEAEASEPSEPSHALTLGLKEYAGTYTSREYGSLTLCAPTSASDYCAGVLSAFGALEPSGRPRARAALYAGFPRIWTTHFRLTHAANDTFRSAFTALFPRGYGRDEGAFETSEVGGPDGRATFVVDGNRVRGFSLVVDEESFKARVRAGVEPEYAADTWFSKVQPARRFGAAEGEL